MKYQYNYSFLEQWLQANRDIQKKDVLKALGIKSNNGLKAWTDGKGPMPVLNILRFCNSFQVPLACFFCDAETGNIAEVLPSAPNISDQLEPVGGYDNGERGRGLRQFDDPTACTSQASKIPHAYGTFGKTEGEASETVAVKTEGDTSGTVAGDASGENAMRTAVTMEQLMEIIVKYDKMQEERIKYLDIIAKQMEQISELTRKITSIQERPYKVVKEYGNEDLARFVAEGD